MPHDELIGNVLIGLLFSMFAIVERIGNRTKFTAWLKRRFEKNLYTPSRQRWLEEVPAVLDARRQAIHSWFFRQLPWTGIWIVLHAVAQSLFPASYPVLKLWLIVAVFATMLWPASLFRIRLAARRAAVPGAPFARRLRWYATLCFLGGASGCLGLALLVGLSLIASYGYMTR